MYTSIVLVALTGSVLASSPAEALTWHNDYAEARSVGQSVKKPLAVIVGSGQTGYDKLSRDGKLSPEVQKALADNYVCTYVDASTPEGRKLASRFAITSGTGLVLSDRSGNLQAFYHDGSLSDADLVRWTNYFADPNVTVRSTMTNGATQVSYYPPENALGSAANYAPIGYAGGYGMSGGYYGGPVWYGGGGCAGGSCGMGGCAGGHCGGRRR